MSRARPLLVPAEPHLDPRVGRSADEAASRDRVQLRFDEALIEARPADTIATALIAAGSLMTSRSPKYRRPRGAYCLTGDCGTCLVRVDGRPNVRACTTAVREGMRVSSQNTYRPRRLDPTALVDSVFRKGMDHHHLMVHPRIANQVMQELARNLTGYGELPDGAEERRFEHVEHELPVVIVGAGPAGRAAARVLEHMGVAHCLIERKDRRQLEAELLTTRDAASEPDRLPGSLLVSCGVFGVYPDPHADIPDHPSAPLLLAASELVPPDAEGQELERLHAFRPRHLLFAIGSREPMLPFANDDLPGIVAARGLVHALARAQARLAGPCVVVGEGERAERLRAVLDGLRSPSAPRVELVAPDQIERAQGSERIESLILRTGRLPCALLAVAAAPAPAHELAMQAGAKVRWNGAGFAVARDEQGRCGSLDATTLWACGDVCGYLGAHAAARDGARVAEQLVEALAAEPVSATRHLAPIAPPGQPPMHERAVVGDAFSSYPNDASASYPNDASASYPNDAFASYPTRPDPERHNG